MRKGAIIFLLDSSYLKGLQTFLYSLQYALQERTEDIVVFTNDKKIHDNEFIHLIADKVILISDEQLSRLKQSKKQKISKYKKIDSIGKYTFLKFFVFSDLGYDYHLFFDVDMLCLDNKFRFNHLVGNYDFAGVGTSGYKYLGISENKNVTNEQRKKIYANIINQKSNSLHSLNSGVMYIGKSLLSNKSVDSLIRLVVNKAYFLEQHATFEFIQSSNVRIKAFPIFYNFSYLAVQSLGKDYFDKLKNKIVFLHYNRKKPWEYKENWIYKIWNDMYKQSQNYDFTQLFIKG